ncbi:uncharacterized protein JCM15063_005239 [Sporobolomyces koalae]|uniref:uncharacterized protein n=1 Tax=Sporobolomyces koalae TaxID=500713 RepID=UPI003179E74F
MAPPMPAEILKLRELMSNDPSQGASAVGAWDQAWRAQITPWDSKLKDVQPSLRELVEEHWQSVKGVTWESLQDGKALVAGCGRGYDAIYFASKGISAVGLDLSPTAVEAAREHLANLPGEARTNVRFEAADFFQFSLPQDERFSLAYDFTFFCAIPPEWRTKWGESYARLVRPGGVLITLEYPLDGDRQGGPPFSVSEEAYDEVLSPNFEQVYHAVPTKQSEGHQGRERIVVWRRK